MHHEYLTGENRCESTESFLAHKHRVSKLNKRKFFRHKNDQTPQTSKSLLIVLTFIYNMK